MAIIFGVLIFLVLGIEPTHGLMHAKHPALIFVIIWLLFVYQSVVVCPYALV